MREFYVHEGENWYFDDELSVFEIWYPWTLVKFGIQLHVADQNHSSQIRCTEGVINLSPSAAERNSSAGVVVELLIE